ncbi:hypothetical protein AHF37_00132 [Paragonimus kellicotti]|nr:hypothetical protein AHF37_00132 [Paragonimus kellicotti]
MRQHDLARHKNAKLTDLEEEARKQAEVLLQKALEQRQDQEDEIRELNELILNAKIQAIRDEQILEKQQIKKEMSEEELRLDNMMELARQDAIRIQEEIDKKRHEQASMFICWLFVSEREAAYEAEQARIRQEKELEIARLRALQERASDEAAERDALRAKRAAEAREREWRLKEKADALKKQETEDLLKRARITQAEERRRLLAIEAGRERMEFERILKRQKEMMDNDQREQNETKLKNQKYAEEIRRQICLKEQERISERNAFFEEGVRLEEEARLRRMRLMDAKNRKLKELRAAGIPEKYLHQVERKALQTGEGQKQGTTGFDKHRETEF